MIHVYDVGDTVRLQCSFSVAGTPTDPTTVELWVKAPDGAVVKYAYGQGEIQKKAVGVYDRVIPITKPGDWYIRWAGGGAVVAAEEARLRARVPAIEEALSGA